MAQRAQGNTYIYPFIIKYITKGTDEQPDGRCVQGEMCGRGKGAPIPSRGTTLQTSQVVRCSEMLQILSFEGLWGFVT
jgi:hypothetical protein